MKKAKKKKAQDPVQKKKAPKIPKSEYYAEEHELFWPSFGSFQFFRHKL